jgi:hypothetical protein
MNGEPVVIGATASIELTAVMLAHAFWEMDAAQQADFFAELDRIAGVQLCFQMAGVVREIKERVDGGDHHAQNGFQTMLAHAQAYGEGATDYRVWSAHGMIDRMAEEAKRDHT